MLPRRQFPEKFSSGLGNGGDRPLERRMGHATWSGDGTYLSDVLQRSGEDLIVGRRRLQAP